MSSPENRHYRNIVFDIDDTLTDEPAGLRHSFDAVNRQFSLNRTWSDFVQIERNFWLDYRMGKITKPAEYADSGEDQFGRVGADWVRAQRFILLTGDDDLGLAYQILDAFEAAMRESVVPMVGAVAIINYLHAKGYTLIAATDGVHDIAVHKLEAIGVLDKFDKLYSARSTGSIKPNVDFFAPIFVDYGDDRQKYLIIGNSLAADILIANNLGIDSVLLKHDETDRNTDVVAYPTYRIKNLEQLKKII